MKTRIQGVQNVHLNSGEDIIGTVIVNDEANTYEVENPHIPQIAPTPNGITIQLIPFRPWLSNNKSLTFNSWAVAMVALVDHRLSEIYTQQTSGIVIPTTGQVVDLNENKITL